MSIKSDATGRTPRPAAIAASVALPDREARNPLFRYFLHLGLPVSVSLVIHVGLFVFLALKIFELPTRATADIGEWEGHVVAAEDLAAGLQFGNDKLMDAPADALNTDTPAELPPYRVGELDLSALDARTPGPGTGDATGLGLGEGSLSLLGTGGGAGEAGTGGFGTGLGGGAQLGQAGVWNVSVRANRIVYVIDYSGSVSVAVDDLKRELKRSVGRLTPAQSFDVIMFYSVPGDRDEKVMTESFKPRLEPAERDVRQEFFRWIDRRAPRGETEPLEAMRRALALNPEAIFFFSDGYFEDTVVGEIERANRTARARIYCLVFDEILLEDKSGLPRETEGVRRLKRIAEGNGGKVKIVTGKDFSQ
jgi:hypothetical protein